MCGLTVLLAAFLCWCCCSILRSNKKHKLIALNESKYVRRCEGLVLGPGFFVRGLEYSADVQAIVIGKPSEEFFRSAIPPNIKPEECVMIGDVSNRLPS